MSNKNKYFSLSLALFLFFIFSCSKSNYSNPHEIINNDSDLVVVLNKNTYLDGEALDIKSVTYQNTILSWIHVDDKDANYENEEGYFITTNENYPTEAIVKELTMSTNVEQNNLSFFVAYYIFDEQKIHVSNVQTVVIINNNAIKPWVWYVVSAVVIFAVTAMVVFTRRYKEKHS